MIFCWWSSEMYLQVHLHSLLEKGRCKEKERVQWMRVKVIMRSRQTFIHHHLYICGQIYNNIQMRFNREEESDTSRCIIINKRCLEEGRIEEKESLMMYMMYYLFLLLSFLHLTCHPWFPFCFFFPSTSSVISFMQWWLFMVIILVKYKTHNKISTQTSSSSHFVRDLWCKNVFCRPRSLSLSVFLQKCIRLCVFSVKCKEFKNPLPLSLISYLISWYAGDATRHSFFCCCWGFPYSHGVSSLFSPCECWRDPHSLRDTFIVQS
jgi:hypothetical protein